jgi:hypothetical protein
VAGLPFKATYLFRPGFIQPLRGIRSKTRFLRILYAAVGPLYPLWKLLFPRYVTTTEHIGRAMIAVARDGAAQPVLENRDIDRIGRQAPR